ncbi:MAG: hypothetical protein PHS93_03140 [Candidatus Omnitrophica bacterium]|nr:hypothetical protein [Candidatus Omnitrophota bacterium]MDD5352146.1 hypothetical protein [Candidatus Omnitrophota bacterium]MDD5549744.1 hypothetical protein [Candidatus Omnitrophota bacterium]
MAKLTKEQKKIIYLGLIAVVFLFLFWFFVYMPQTRRLASIKNELASVESQIAEIIRITEGRELTEAVKDFNTQIIEGANILSFKQEDIISSLLQEARNFKIDVKSITPLARKSLENKIPGFTIEELPISMVLSGEFRDLGEYLNILKNRFPVLIKVRQLDIKGNGEGRAILDATLQISAFLSKLTSNTK